MSNEKVKWRPVVGYEGFYEISNRGKVRSIERTITCSNGTTRWVRGRYLKQTELSIGYRVVTLCKNGVSKNHYVHILVTHAFIGIPGEGYCVNHRNGIKTENVVSNLEIVSHRENFHHAMRMGLWDYRGSKNGMSKLKEDDVREIRRLCRDGVRHEDIAVRFGICTSNISHIHQRIRWKHVTE